MAFQCTSQTVKPGIVVVTLTGELDASTAPAFKNEVEKAAGQELKRLVLMMRDLDYMASAGVRVLVFAKQKMSAGVEVFVVCPQESVLETLQLTGMEHALDILEDYDATRIEN